MNYGHSETPKGDTILSQGIGGILGLKISQKNSKGEFKNGVFRDF
jgi:hypothetical protein